MSEIERDQFLDQEITNLIHEQAEEAVIPSEPPINHRSRDCSELQRIQCATTYGNQAIDNKILISISENINKMAQAINDSEKQKSHARNGYIKFFSILLVILIVFTGFLIVADTFFGFRVRIEFMISVIIAIIADVFAIVQTLVKYMTSVNHYEVYNKLIDSLLKYINRGS